MGWYFRVHYGNGINFKYINPNESAKTQSPYIAKKNLLRLKHILEKIYPTNIFNSSGSLARDHFNIKNRLLYVWFFSTIETKRYHDRVIPDSKIHEANMGPTWVLSAPDGPHVGLINLAIRDLYNGPHARKAFFLKKTRAKFVPA